MASWTDRALLLSCLGLTVACNPKPATPDSGLPEPECETLIWNWQNTGEPFMRTWCTSCHHSDLDDDSRQGAPIDVNLETYADFVRWAERVDARVWATSAPMPPAGGPTEEELDLLGTWMDCGAPE